MSKDDALSKDRSAPPLAPTVVASGVSPGKVDSTRGKQVNWFKRLFGGRTRAPRQPPARKELESILRGAVPASRERFQRSELIGEGGMATVELLSDHALRRKAAVKTLLPEMETEVQAVQAFIREAQVTGQLNHPNIVPIYDLATTEDGRPFFTMQLLEADTLADLVLDLPPGPVERGQLLDLLEIVLKVCNALAYAHKRGVIHRDLKPENVMVGDFGSVYVVDWGLARLTDRTLPAGGKQDELSSSFRRIWGSRVVGTPGYMSPEQASGGEIDERSDVFAIGAILYFLIARQSPFTGSTAEEILERAERGEFLPLVEVASPGAVPRELDRVIARSLSRQPDDRQQTVLELRQDITAFMRGGSLPRQEFREGEEIIREGDVGEHSYIIVSGRCEVRKMKDGEQQQIRVIGPGECFGETAIMTEGSRTATVVAIEPVVVERVTSEEFLEELDTLKPWVSIFLRSLAGRFRERETAD